MIAYKLVNRDFQGNYSSPINISNRIRQIDPGGGRGVKKTKTRGVMLDYTIGKLTRSKQPGIYLYRDMPPHECWSASLKVRIPAGTEIRLGDMTINALCVIPIEEV
jgi:hypothetical protein